ncbi:hypothetical protein TREMEDRAFT_68703 [Tremella mesenterica DSM 1558]|uniref:uncharacterized protein n=1 Tax=Tremella mesenterica (strain ATCC 24925 / CBS 8224 / DSM 1558 / NBRC 9311 / NRRL Y-6157 / RJB 2259-6 / UBC 559-6) TaxID=578456 RepID=UPI0003F49B5D|nr:uncharacterized protein TREMEDRAFT_68703 [Tremella mesenterica DSM 1558]EIW69462.1 hypothetical protein TREMEDRAFT_68703 [Tremella mesenterica DSM 1558]
MIKTLSRPPFPSGWGSIPTTLSNLSLSNTLPVGQSFLWHKRTLPAAGPDEPLEEYSRAIRNPCRVIFLRQSIHRLHYVSLLPDGSTSKDEETRQWLEDYFQLVNYPDLSLLYKEWRDRDTELFGKIEFDKKAIGVRVLRQDPWECLISFITSTNNHITRISSLMHKLSINYSKPLFTIEQFEGSSSITYHPFPIPEDFPDSFETNLRQLGFGYRASFIESSIKSLRQQFGSNPGSIEKGLVDLRKKDLDVIGECLISLKGVGRKVADCVMLMSLDQPSLIPVDTHVASIAARHPSFPSRLRNKTMSKQMYDDIQLFLADRWGPLGGWCQAVMFAADLPPIRPAEVSCSVSDELGFCESKNVVMVDQIIQDVKPISVAKSRSKRSKRTSDGVDNGVVLEHKRTRRVSGTPRSTS